MFQKHLITLVHPPLVIGHPKSDSPAYGWIKDLKSGTPSMRHAIEGLKLKRLDLLHAGEKTYPLGEKIRAVVFSRMLADLEPLGMVIGFFGLVEFIGLVGA